MIHRRTLIREMSLSAGSILTILIAISLVTLFIRLLGDVARGKIANEAVFAFLGFSLLHSLPVLLSIALFAGVLTTLSRMWRDSEMIVWLSSGLSFTQWIRPVLVFALPLTLLILLLTAWLDPWALEKRNEYRDELKSRAEMALITPGLFAEGSGGDRVYFVETMNPLTGVVRNIFLRAHIDGQLGLVTAREGSYTPMKDGSRYLVLEDGRRYEGVPGKLDYRIIEFERYWMRLDAAEVRPGKVSPKQASLSELVEDGSPMARGELLWRVGLPVSALILAIMAIPLSFVNVRARRSYGLVVALLVFFIYNNMLSLSQAWVAQDKLNPWLGAVSMHVVMALATVALFYLRTHPDPFRRKKR